MDRAVVAANGRVSIVTANEYARRRLHAGTLLCPCCHQPVIFGLATRYCKRAASFEAAIQIRCLALWLQIS